MSTYDKFMSGVLKKLFFSESFSKGFTLVELLILMAVLIILFSTVLVAVNPIENIHRAKDTRRISAVVELGHSMEALATTRENGKYPNDPVGMTNWQSSFLVASNEIPAAVSVDAAESNCTINSQGNLCYDSNGTDAVIWSVLESSVNRNNAGCVGSEIVVAVWIGSQGKTGLTCISGVNSIPSYSSVIN